MKKRPKTVILERIRELEELTRRLKEFKNQNGYCAENVSCLAKPKKGYRGCDSCLADVDPRR